jgi:hypothetical protein
MHLQLTLETRVGKERRQRLEGAGRGFFATRIGLAFILEVGYYGRVRVRAHSVGQVGD